VTARLVVALANARAPRRPPRARVPVAYDALADAASANELLGSFLDHPVKPHELTTVRALQGAVEMIADALIDGSPPPANALKALNALAAEQEVTYAIERQRDGTLRTTLRPQRASTVATLVIGVMDELAALEPSRLRRCARHECNLVFYDATRSGTQRWHAERPCGLRERQRRHRISHRLR